MYHLILIIHWILKDNMIYHMLMELEHNLTANCWQKLNRIYYFRSVFVIKLVYTLELKMRHVWYFVKARKRISVQFNTGIKKQTFCKYLIDYDSRFCLISVVYYMYYYILSYYFIIFQILIVDIVITCEVWLSDLWLNYKFHYIFKIYWYYRNIINQIILITMNSLSKSIENHF